MAEKKLKNKWLSFLIDGILSGMMIAFGGVVSLSSDNRYMGAFLFSLGLFCVIHFKYGLYTGKVGYIVDRDKAYLGETFVTLFANGIGTAIVAFLMRCTRFKDALVVNSDVSIVEKAQASMTAKLGDTYWSTFILAIFCGLMMFTAVEGNRLCSERKNFVAGLFVTVLPVMVFIISGFNHCVADMFYYFLAGCPTPGKAVIYFILAILGNLVGGILVPMAKRLSNNPLVP